MKWNKGRPVGSPFGILKMKSDANLAFVMNGIGGFSITLRKKDNSPISH